MAVTSCASLKAVMFRVVSLCMSYMMDRQEPEAGQRLL
jgi:hypothetical protein